MKLDARILTTTAAVVVALGAGYGLARLTDRPAPQAEAGEAEHGEDHAAEEGFVALTAEAARAAGVAVVTAAPAGVGDLRLTGRVVAAPGGRAAVAAPVGGSVERVLAAPGLTIAAGAPLASIRSAEAAAFAAETRAAAAEAQAARAALAREERLFAAGVTARQEVEAARASAARAEAQAVAARARSAASGGPGASGLVTIRSPIAGVVLALPVAPGGFVAQGGPVAEIADPGQVEAVFNAPAEALGSLKMGAALRILGPDGTETQAVIVGVAPMAQDATGAAVVRARPRDGRLAAGAAVSAAFATGSGGGLAVPSEAVQTLEGAPVVFVAEAKGFRARPVTVGKSGAGLTQILSGLKAGERVAGRGAFVLKAELAKGEAGHGDH